MKKEVRVVVSPVPRKEPDFKKLGRLLIELVLEEEAESKAGVNKADEAEAAS